MIHSLRITGSLLLLSMLARTEANAQLPTVPPSHIVILIEENYAYSDIIGSSYAPHINALCADPNAAVFTQFYAIEHPSEPNYLDMYSGQNQGTTGSDGVPAGIPFTTANMGAELLAASKTFITYSEDLPSPGYNGASYTSGGANYARKHNPCTNWQGTGTNQYSGTVVNLPYTSFPASTAYASLPTVCYVVPNMTNDMHDGTYPSNITTGDTWYNTHLASLLPWALANNTLFIIIFDEDDNLHGNNIPAIFYGPMVKGGIYSNHETIVNLLGTIETMYGLGHAGSPFTGTITNDSAITYCWKNPSTGINNVSKEYSFSVVPNPASDVISFNCNNTSGTAVSISVTDMMGRETGKYTMTGAEMKVNTTSYASGLYCYKATDENNNLVGQGKFVITHK